MLKCSSERWVCAPHSLSVGTSTIPRLSVSFLISTMDLSWVCYVKPLRGWRLSHVVADTQVWKCSDVLDLEHRRGFGAGASAGVRIGLEINPVGRNDRLQPG